MDENHLQDPCILIVDDTESQRFLLKNIVEDMGCRPVLAESGRQALRVFSGCRPALVLLDVSMPEMDGFEVCAKLKADPDSRNVPVLFISAFESREEIVKVFEAGGADYVTKPFVPEAVKARVGAYLKLARRG